MKLFANMPARVYTGHSVRLKRALVKIPEQTFVETVCIKKKKKNSTHCRVFSGQLFVRIQCLFGSTTCCKLQYVVGHQQVYVV